jgi:hypothetical protein
MGNFSSQIVGVGIRKRTNKCVHKKDKFMNKQSWSDTDSLFEITVQELKWNQEVQWQYIRNTTVRGIARQKRQQIQQITVSYRQHIVTDNIDNLAAS